MFACWHFVSIFWRCYVIILQFGWFVCVCVFADITCGLVKGEQKGRQDTYATQINKSTSQFYGVASFGVPFFCFDVEHGASFFSGNFLKIEVLNQDWKTQNVASVATGQWVQHHLWCAEVQGVERDWCRQWMAYFLDSPLHLAWHEVGIGICWQLKYVGIYLAYTWYMLMAEISLSTGDCVSGWVKLLLECCYIDESWLAKSWSTSC